MASPLDLLAARVETDPAFLANALAEYARSEGLDDAALARALGCAVGQLTPLRLCLRLRSDRIGEDADEVAGRFGVSRDALIAVVRRADALQALRGGAGMAGTLMAARDRDVSANGHDRQDGGPV